MKEKIEDKLQYIKDAGFELTDYETVDMLSTLIQEERKEAVEGFVKYLERRNKDWFCGLLEGIYLLRAKRYLQSSDKGDKITSNTLTITEEELENASYTSSTIESEGK